MKKNNYKEISTNSRNKKYELKTKLTSLADKAKARINKNKVLKELIVFYKDQISQDKNKFLKYSTLKLIAKNNQELSNSIQKELKSNNSSIKLENDSLQRTIRALKIKYDTNISKGREIIDSIYDSYDAVQEKNFLISNAFQSKENDIKEISKTISHIKEEGYQLIIDSVEYFEKELEDEIDLRDELKKDMEYHTLLYDQKLMQINKYINDCKKRAEKISNLKIIKKNIKKYIRTLTNLLANFDCISFPENRNIVIEGEECLQEAIGMKPENINNNGISLSEESESFLNETDLNLDVKEFELIRNNLLEEKSKLITNSPIPKLDLALINFNKQKLNYDYDEKSLSRNDMKEHDLLSMRIIKLKDEIKALTDKNDKLCEKIKKYREKIYKLNQIIINMNYQNPNTIRIKSVKKRKFLFNETPVFTNSSKNSKSISYRVGGFRNNNKLNLNGEI